MSRLGEFLMAMQRHVMVEAETTREFHDSFSVWDTVKGVPSIATEWLPGSGYFLTARGTPAGIERLATRIGERFPAIAARLRADLEESLKETRL